MMQGNYVHQMEADFSHSALQLVGSFMDRSSYN